MPSIVEVHEQRVPSGGANTPPAVPLDRIAVVVGLTGHADLDPAFEPELRERIYAVLTDIGAAHPDTPLVGLTTLASGAGLLGAEAALARGIPLVACLPIEPALMHETFADEADRARFAEIVNRCARVDIVVREDGEDDAHVAGARYVAGFSDIIVALWDGAPAEPGELAEVLEAKLNGSRQRDCKAPTIPQAPDVGPVYQLVAPRRALPLPSKPGTLVQHEPHRFSGDRTFAVDFSAALQRIDAFNADLNRLAPVAATPRAYGSIAELRDRIDAIAGLLQAQTFRFLYILYATAIVATAAQYLESPLLKFLMFPIAFGVYKLARHFDYENRYQDYRVLSEGLRVQSAWLSAGLHEKADQSYLGAQRGDLLWIRIGLRYAYWAFHRQAETGRLDAEETKTWISGQLNYFRDTPVREARRLARCVVGSRATLYVAIAVSAVCFFVLNVAHLPGTIATLLGKLPAFASGASAAHAMQAQWDAASLSQTSWLGNLNRWQAATGVHSVLARLSTGALAMYAAVALLISNYAEKQGYALNVKRYKRMFVVFDQTNRRITPLTTRPAASLNERECQDAAELIRDLGREALVENGDWLLTRRERPFTFVS